MKKLLFVLYSLCIFSAFSQSALKPVTWTATYIETSSTEGEIVLTASIEKKWHIYSQRPTDVGPIPTSFTVATSVNYDLIGKVNEGEAHEEYVAAFDAKVFVFSGEAVFKQKIKRKNKKSFSIEILFEFMTCNDVQCLPPSLNSFLVNVPDVTNIKK